MPHRVTTWSSSTPTTPGSRIVCHGSPRRLWPGPTWPSSRPTRGWSARQGRRALPRRRRALRGGRPAPGHPLVELRLHPRRRSPLRVGGGGWDGRAPHRWRRLGPVAEAGATGRWPREHRGATSPLPPVARQHDSRPDEDALRPDRCSRHGTGGNRPHGRGAAPRPLAAGGGAPEVRRAPDRRGATPTRSHLRASSSTRTRSPTCATDRCRPAGSAGHGQIGGQGGSSSARSSTGAGTAAVSSNHRRTKGAWLPPTPAPRGAEAAARRGPAPPCERPVGKPRALDRPRSCPPTTPTGERCWTERTSGGGPRWLPRHRGGRGTRPPGAPRAGGHEQVSALPSQRLSLS